MNLLLLLANGFEEIEALGTLDLLRRGNVSVTTCTLNRTPLTLGAHNIAVEAELCLTELDSTLFDGVILPGGLGGSQALASTQGVLELLRDYQQQGKLICAICAAPALVLTAANVLAGRKATCYPAPEFIELLGEQYCDAPAVTDGTLITAAGPGCFADFAKAILDVVAPGQSEGVFKAALLTR
jgi:4-methyl-5(b-hydroxyethyl)-thiazole monophosphate biosynthesis